MAEILAYCGMDCGICPVYRATQADDDAAREKAASFFSKLFNTDIPLQAINCDGCTAITGKLFGHCDSCEVRACARARDLDICAQCPEYSCEKLDRQLAQIPIPQPRERLEEIRKDILGNA